MGVGFVEVIVLGDLFEMKPLIPAAFLVVRFSTFYLILLTIAIWLRDLLLDIFVTES